MRIVRISCYALNATKSRPVQLSIGRRMLEVENLFIRLETDTGMTGWGEASPFEPITGDSQASNIAAAKHLAAIVKGNDPREIDRLVSTLYGLTAGEPSILSAFDMALHDLAARAADVPLYLYLGGTKRALRTDRTISLCDGVDASIAKAEELIGAGIREIKIKTGRSGLQDIEHIKAVRATVGEEVAITIDSNGAWDLAAAIANISAMEKFNVCYSEQPLPRWNIVGLAELRRKVSVPICADESAFDDKDALRLIKADAIDYLNIKLGKSRGIATALRINAICEAAGKACMIGCFAESRLGLTAAAHLAMAKTNIRFLDLDSARGLPFDPIFGGAVFNYDCGGIITLDDGPGLACDVDYNSVSEVFSL